MADPPITAPPDAEAPVAKQGASPRFFRDGRRDAFFEDEAGSEPSKRRKNGKPEDRSFHYDESTSRQKPPPPSVVVGKLHLLKYPKDEVLVDFNPLENLAYSGAKLVNADEDTKVESYQDMGGDDAGAATTKVNGDDDDWRIAAKEQDKLADDVRAQYALDLRSLRQKPENPDSPTRIEWLAIITCRLLKEALADEMIAPDAFDTTLDQARYKPSKELIHALIDRLGSRRGSAETCRRASRRPRARPRTRRSSPTTTSARDSPT